MPRGKPKKTIEPLAKKELPKAESKAEVEPKPVEPKVEKSKSKAKPKAEKVFTFEEQLTRATVKENGLVVVKLKRSYSPLNAGETAGFKPDEARFIVEEGLGVFVPRGKNS